jgi:hypothetical protein
MAEERTDPLADLFTLVATPVAGALRSVEQFRRGVDEFLRGVENFNRTMENLNQTAERINTLLAEVEPPLRAAIPQVTRTVQTADQVMQVVGGPAMAVAPGLERLAEVLSNPALNQIPSQLTQFSDVLGELSRRMGPLSTFAETAGGLFGMRNPMGRASTPPTEHHSPEPASTPTPTARSASSAKTSARSSTAAKKRAPKK